MLCNREEFSFRNVYVSMLVCIVLTCHQNTNSYTRPSDSRNSDYKIRSAVLDDNVKSKENVKISKSVSLYSFSFQQFYINLNNFVGIYQKRNKKTAGDRV